MQERKQMLRRKRRRKSRYSVCWLRTASNEPLPLRYLARSPASPVIPDISSFRFIHSTQAAQGSPALYSFHRCIAQCSCFRISVLYAST